MDSWICRARPISKTLPLIKFESEDRHGLNRVDISGLGSINHLKELLAHPPRDVIEEIAKETQNPALVKEVADERAADIAREFCNKHPEYLKCHANWLSMVETMSQKCLGEDDIDVDDAQDRLIEGGHWTLQNLESAFRALKRAGVLEYPSNYARPLTEAQRIRVQQLAANGDVLGAISAYVEGRFGQDAGFQVAFVLDDPDYFITDPKVRPVLQEAVFFVWENSRKDYSPTEARRRYLHDYCADRYVTLALLDAGWENCKEAEKQATRSALLNPIQEAPRPPANDGFDAPDDASIDRLYHETLREYARTARRQRGRKFKDFPASSRVASHSRLAASVCARMDTGLRGTSWS